VNHYLVEAYQPVLNEAQRAELVARARTAAEGMSLEGMRVEYLRTIFVPGDETCFHVDAASSGDAVREVNERGGLGGQRVVEAYE